MEFEKVRDIIVETLGCDAEQVTLEASLADDLGAGVGKVGVFRQKAVAGVEAVAAGGLGHRQQGVLVQVAVRGPGGADAHRLGGQLDMEGLRVRFGVDGHGLNVHFPAGPQHPQRDLAPVGDQDPLQHGL